MKVLAYGEVLWDIIEGTPYIGGAPFNFAAHVVKNKGTASILSAVGKDDLGVKAISEAERLGVQTDLIQIRSDKPTGKVDVFLKDGQPDYTIHEDVAFDAIFPEDLSKIKQEHFDVFYSGSLAQRERASRETLEKILDEVSFPEIFYDINIRKSYYSPSIIRSSLKKATIFKINDQESQLVSRLFYGSESDFEVFARRISEDFDVKVVIITAAEKGCYLFTAEGFHHIPAMPVTLADAVGAGDAFSAAFIMQMLSGADYITAARRANVVGAFVASQ
ncbi:MAG: carbohydrate kinase family protein, partial [Cyclobacteriaceae bacterium]